jgi:hypothetical protein
MIRMGKVEILIPPIAPKQKTEYICELCLEMDRLVEAEFYTRVAIGPYRIDGKVSPFKLLCKKHHQSHGLGFGPEIGYKIKDLLKDA